MSSDPESILAEALRELLRIVRNCRSLLELPDDPCTSGTAGDRPQESSPVPLSLEMPPQTDLRNRAER